MEGVDGSENTYGVIPMLGAVVSGAMALASDLL